MADSKISDLTAETALTSTDMLPVATAGGATKKITAANLRLDILAQSQDSKNGHAGVMVPTALSWAPVSAGFTANRAGLSRFCLTCNFTVTSMVFRTSTAGTGNVDVGIYDSAASPNLLKTSGSTSGKKGANTTQTVNLSSTLALTAGTVYYAVIVSDTGDGAYSAATYAGITGQLFGTVSPTMEEGFKDTTFPLPSALASPGYTSALGPVFVLI